MPNGGSDCCGTCWFNGKNEGKAGYHAMEKEGEVICEIRGLKIENPFWTYCANHPHHNPTKINIPIGAVYVCDSSTSHKREVWIVSPDTEEIRLNLLNLLSGISEEILDEYPSPTKLNYEVIIQLGLFKENKAIEGLKRVLEFNVGGSQFALDKHFTVGYALEALAKISFDEALPFIEKFIIYGLNELANDGKDKYAVLRYHAVKSLQHFPINKVRPFISLAETDPNLEISALAKQIRGI